MRTINHNYLLDRMCERFGDAPVDKLVAAYGCRKLYVPLNPSAQNQELLGGDVAKWLREHFASQFIEIPSKTRAVIR